MSNIPDVSTETPLSTFRYFMIRIIAGKHMVMLNTQVDMVDRKVDIAARVVNTKGGYINNCAFPDYSDKMIQLSQVKL